MQRLKNGKRRQVPHRKRAKFGGSALIVTVHQLDGLPNLRTQKVMGVFQKALAIAKDRFGCRVLQFTLLGNHVHFMVEAPDEKSLGRAMKGLLVRLAKALNKLWGRKGHVFERRFHSVVVSTMRQVHRALRYVLLNARKHSSLPPGFVDQCSSAPWFRGFTRPEALAFGATAARSDWARSSGKEEPPVAAPRSWLLRVGYQRAGPFDVDDAPRGH